MEYRITREIKDDELFHSDEFLGDEFTDELYHWKYIKKKRVNGKWRYYYDVKDALGYDEREKAANDMYTYKQAYKNYNNGTHRNTSELRYESHRVESLRKKAEASMKAYQKTPIGKLDSMKESLTVGKKAISNFLEKAARKIKPENRLDRYRTINVDMVPVYEKNSKKNKI